MKSASKCILSFFILFSIVDFSVINLFRNFNFNSVSSSASISDVIKIQKNLLEQTKIVVTNVCDNIIKDLKIFLTAKKSTKTFIDLYNLFFNKEYFTYCILSAIPLIQKLSNISLYRNNEKVALFFFAFIFMFIVGYLGLLFTFGKKNIYQQYRKAYSM